MRVVDALGAAIAVVAAPAVTLDPGTTVLGFSWSTGTHLPGGYSAVAELLVAGSPVAQAASSFSIARDAGTRASLFSDRDVYTPLQVAILTGSVGNTGQNDLLTDLTATIAISDQGGSEVFQSSRQLLVLFPGSDSPVNATWEIGGAAAGIYSASLSLRNAFGVLLAYASTQLAVEDSSQTGAGLDGELVVSPTTVGSGAPLLADFTLQNHGNAAMPDLQVRIDVVRLADGERLRRPEA